MIFRHNGIEGTLGDIGSTAQDNNNIFSGNYTATPNYRLYRFINNGSGCPTTGLLRNVIFTTNPVLSGADLSCTNAAYVIQSNNGANKVQSCATASYEAVYQFNPISNGSIVLKSKRVAANQEAYSEYPVGSRWLDECETFHLLKTYPSLMSGDSLLSAFYQTTLGTAISNIEHVNELIGIVDTTTDTTAFIQAWQDAAGANMAMQTPNLQATNEQAINNIYLKYAIGGLDTLTSADSGVIGAMALSCPLKGGNAVFKARRLYVHYKPLLHYNDLGLCNYPDSTSTTGIYDAEEAFLDSLNNPSNGGNNNRMVHNMGSGEEQFGALKLYPNPVNSTLNIDYPHEGVLEITDITGRKIQSVTLTGSKGGKAVIDTRNLSVGILMYRYLVEGKMVEAGKIVVQHE